MSAVVAFLAGLLFALGLGLGGMTQPARVVGFLDVFGAWDPALSFVMAGAVATYALLRPVVMHRSRPLLAGTFAVPERLEIDAALVGGAALFGVGWGLVGYCPGPAIVALGAAVPQAALFVAAMMAGMMLYQRRTVSMKHWLNDRLAVGDAPDADEMARLAAEGFRTIIDLRSDGEPHPRGLPSWEEAKVARALGLAYRQIVVEPQMLGDALAHVVRDAVATAPSPVLLHCTTARRAGTFGLVILATEQDLDVDACLARGRAMGLDWDHMPRLTAFLRHFVERHGRHYRTEEATVRRRSGSG